MRLYNVDFVVWNEMAAYNIRPNIWISIARSIYFFFIERCYITLEAIYDLFNKIYHVTHLINMNTQSNIYNGGAAWNSYLSKINFILLNVAIAGFTGMNRKWSPIANRNIFQIAKFTKKTKPKQKIRNEIKKNETKTLRNAKDVAWKLHVNMWD